MPLLTALETARFVIITGGLGPTDDDITNEIVAHAPEKASLSGPDHVP